MKTSLLIFSLALLLGILACGTSAPLPAPEPAPATETFAVPEPKTPAPTSPLPVSTASPEPTAPSPSGFRVIYLREGNLWSWTEAGGSVQLTGTGDMSAARLSADGQLLAFMRGSDVWTVRMDGTDVRLLATQPAEGGSLWFAPNGTFLAVSTKDRIDVINLQDAVSSTVVTYPAIPGGYFPEIAWMMDSTGFKTVIPPQVGTGQAELLFVFTNGTVASLAKFSMAPLSDSLPFISPDGGYIIYSAKSETDKQSLHLMDSSGAARPYGEPSQKVRAYGWLPDAKRFAYGDEILKRAYLGNIDGSPVEIPVTFPPKVRWIDSNHYLALENGNLILGSLHGESLQIDSGVQEFDFTLQASSP